MKPLLDIMHLREVISIRQGQAEIMNLPIDKTIQKGLVECPI